MLKPTLVTIALLFLATPAFAEEEATMHQVYLAAEAGKFSEAQSMMDKVLRDHPNSAKAHFVEAELLAKQGQLGNASVELNTAERLQPGLPFAKPEALQSLKRRIAAASNGVIQPNLAHQNIASAVKDWMPSLLLILGIGIIVLLIVFKSRRSSEMIPANNYGRNATGPNIPPVGTTGTNQIMGQPAAGGMGSGIMGSLATGAALGAGVVAGEALMRHFTDGDRNNAIPESPHHDTSPWNTPGNISENDDMGGTDFGVADASSWDDGFSNDGGDDWT